MKAWGSRYSSDAYRSPRAEFRHFVISSRGKCRLSDKKYQKVV